MAKKAVAAKKTAKKRVRKNVDRGQAHIQSSFNNTIVTLTDSEGTKDLHFFNTGLISLAIVLYLLLDSSTLWRSAPIMWNWSDILDAGYFNVLVNGKCVNIPSYQVKPGDVISIKEKVKSMQRYKDILEHDSPLHPAGKKA